MSPEEKHKINVWIPESLWKQIEILGYGSPTKATIAAFEALVLQEVEGSNKEEIGRNQEIKIRDLENQIHEAERQIKSLEESLSQAPDPIELAQIRAKSEELERHNSTLKEELDKAGRREEDLKQIHNNYFLQIQTLINQKAIEAPGAKKAWYKFW